MKNMSKIWLGVIGIVALTQCSPVEDSSIVLHLTDGPLGANDVTGVYVTISDLEYRLSEGEWQDVPNFKRIEEVNLVELTDGNPFTIGEFPAIPGNYAALRFRIEAPIQGEEGVKNPESYLEFSSGETAPLYLPEGSSYIFQADGTFQVPLSGTTELVADFGTRRGISFSADNGTYTLDPQIRVVSLTHSGTIKGELKNFESIGAYTMVYAFKSGSFNPSASNESFTNAVAWDVIHENSFELRSLTRNDYDLYFVAFDANGEVLEQQGEIQSISVDAGNVTTVFIDGNDL